MKIYNNPTLDQKHCNGVIAIGNLIIHLGHQKVINEANEKPKIRYLLELLLLSQSL